MVTTLFLWLTVLIFSFHVAGHLFDILAIQPNWKSGEINDIKNFITFHHKSDPSAFFRPVVTSSVILPLITCILVWNSTREQRIFSCATLIIGVIVFAISVGIFLPINKYLFSKTQELDSAEVKKKVSIWMRLETFRFILLVIGLVTAIMTLNAALSR